MPLLAVAEEGEREGREGRGGRGNMPAASNTKWQQECGTCHVAYPPWLLPAESWRKVMAGLERHFGSDASLTPAENKEIIAFLVKNGSTDWSAGSTPLRITETAGFRRKHQGDEVPAGVWKRASVKSAANCQACHAGAAKGDFNEDAVRIPN
jgi:hypothetical protein